MGGVAGGQSWKMALGGVWRRCSLLAPVAIKIHQPSYAGMTQVPRPSTVPPPSIAGVLFDVLENEDQSHKMNKRVEKERVCPISIHRKYLREHS